MRNNASLFTYTHHALHTIFCLCVYAYMMVSEQNHLTVNLFWSLIVTNNTSSEININKQVPKYKDIFKGISDRAKRLFNVSITHSHETEIQAPCVCCYSVKATFKCVCPFVYQILNK